ncbi:hypothetical protein K3495_g8462 [Podosphaera aphanis]|nr:hypothetical protein K3495_g8462 [Podosphaera aphanis]
MSGTTRPGQAATPTRGIRVDMASSLRGRVARTLDAARTREARCEIHVADRVVQTAPPMLRHFGVDCGDAADESGRSQIQGAVAQNTARAKYSKHVQEEIRGRKRREEEGGGGGGDEVLVCCTAGVAFVWVRPRLHLTRTGKRWPR